MRGRESPRTTSSPPASRKPPMRDHAGHSAGARDRRLAAISPHLDDAVFGSGDAIREHPGASVVTVFAGVPPARGELTPWDVASGFEVGEDAVAARRDEDRAALALLGAVPHWLSFLDSQYADLPAAAEVAEALDVALRLIRPEIVVIPLGIWHSDHALAHEAAISLVARHPQLEWMAYEDAIYRRFPGDGVARRRRDLAARGLQLAPMSPGRPAAEIKRRSIAGYRSQLRALAAPGGPGWEDALEPERHWRLLPRSASRPMPI